MCGEFTIEMIKTGKYECKFNGKPEVIEQIIFAKDKKDCNQNFYGLFESCGQSGEMK